MGASKDATTSGQWVIIELFEKIIMTYAKSCLVFAFK